MINLKIAMLQMLVVPGQLEQNLAHAAEWIDAAQRQGCHIALLPECMDLGWADERARSLAHPVPGATSDFFCELARKHRIHIVAGLNELEDGRLYNTAVLISDKGELIGKHRKVNLLKDVETCYEAGESLRVYNTPLGKLGILICADNLMETVFLGQSMQKMGASVILSPCAWAVQSSKLGSPYGREWIEPYSLLTKGRDLSIVAVSNVGPVNSGVWKGWKVIGNSIAMGPDARMLAQLPYDEEALHVITISQ